MEWLSILWEWVKENLSLANPEFFRLLVVVGMCLIGGSIYETYDEVRNIRGLLQDEFKRGPHGSNVESASEGLSSIPKLKQFHGSADASSYPADEDAGGGHEAD